MGTIRARPGNSIIESTLKRKIHAGRYLPSHLLLNNDIVWTPRRDISGTDSSIASSNLQRRVITRILDTLRPVYDSGEVNHYRCHDYVKTNLLKFVRHVPACPFSSLFRTVHVARLYAYFTLHHACE